MSCAAKSTLGSRLQNNAGEQTSEPGRIVLGLARHRATAWGSPNEVDVALAGAVAPPSPRSASALKLLEELLRNVSNQKTCTLPPQRTIKTLVGFDICNPRVSEQTSKTRLLPQIASPRVLDDERHAGGKVHLAESRASARRAVPERDALETCPFESRDTARELGRTERPLRRDVLHLRVR